MTESIIHSGRKTGFTVLYNSVLKDSRLSLKAKGLFAIMKSLPDDWEYTVSGLSAYIGASKDAIRATLNELQKAGYLVREQSHVKGGKFGGNVFALQDEAPPLSENPDNGENRQRSEPSPDFTTQQKKDLTKERLKQTPIVPKALANMPLEIRQGVVAYAGDDDALLDALWGLLENRKAIRKPVSTLRTLEGILNDLEEHSGGNRARKLRLLEKSITCNWLTIFALKADELPSATVHKVVEAEGVRYL